METKKELLYNRDMKKIELWIQDWDKMDILGIRGFEADWGIPRTLRCVYFTTLEGEAAAEQAFHLTNAPKEILSDGEKWMIRDYRGPCLSVGDVVKVDEVEYLCASTGWEKR